MQTLIRFRWWAVLLLLSGCRSEQVAFSFRPAPMATSTPATRSGTEAAGPAAPAVSAEPPAPTVSVRQVGRPATVRVRVLPRRAVTASRQQVVSRPHPETAAVARPRAPRRHDALHVALGALLVVGGVVAGLALGGWLGLGVGAVVVLLGYYFVVLGIGGKHAWLEIFQEFFNM